MNGKDTFIVRKKYRNQIKKFTANQKVEFMECMFSYQLEWKYESNDWAVCMLLDIMIDERKKDKDKYDERCDKNRQIALEREQKKREKKEQEEYEQHERATSYTNVTNSTYNDYDSDNDSDYIHTNNLITSKEVIEQSSKWNPEINCLIGELKQECNNLWIVYDKTKDRQFAKHILSAKEFWNFCEKIWMDRISFAINIMKASIHINYWKWICSWPMKIYQNYAEVYNKTLQQHSKNEKNLIQSF